VIISRRPFHADRSAKQVTISGWSTNPEKHARTRSSVPLMLGDVAVNTQLIFGVP